MQTESSVLRHNIEGDVLRVGPTGMLYGTWGFVKSLHKDHVDDGGKPYIRHIVNVVNEVAFLGVEDITLMAMLHDSLEQSWNVPYLTSVLRRMLPEPVFLGVLALTRHQKEPYEKHIGRIAVRGSRVMVVKIAELHDNLDLSRLKRPLTDNQIARNSLYIHWYHKLLDLYNNTVDNDAFKLKPSVPTPTRWAEDYHDHDTLGLQSAGDGVSVVD